MEADGEALAVPGVREVLLDSEERPVAVIETVSCSVVRLADVDDRHAIDEGEGYADAAAFRVSHERFWNAYIDDLRRTIGARFRDRRRHPRRAPAVQGRGATPGRLSTIASPRAADDRVVRAWPVGTKLVRSFDASPGPAGLR